MSGDFGYANQYTTKQKPPRSLVQNGGGEPLGTQPHLSSCARTRGAWGRAQKRSRVGECIWIIILHVCPILLNGFDLW